MNKTTAGQIIFHDKQETFFVRISPKSKVESSDLAAPIIRLHQRGCQTTRSRFIKMERRRSYSLEPVKVIILAN